MQQVKPPQNVDIDALKAQVDAEIAARLLQEADYARYIHRRGVCIGSLKLLVGLDATGEVADMPLLFRLPGAPQGVKGLVNRHGRVVPVLDIPELFGLQHEWTSNVWLLVYGRGEEAVGIMIDSLPERKSFDQADAVSLDESTHPVTAYARACYRDGKDVWIDMDMEALFAFVFKAELAGA